MRALCVGRHEFLSDHLGRYFQRFGLEATCVVGIEGAAAVARDARPDVVICDYDLLATMPLDSWQRDEHLARTPVIAVSMTRRPDELHPLDVNGVRGFLYLPLLRGDEAAAALRAVAATSAPPTPVERADARPLPPVASPPYSLGGVLDWPRPSAVASTASSARAGVSDARQSSAHPSPSSPSARDEASGR